jgi:cytochrome c-type biogenesis protein CcmH/NrfF
MKTGRFENIAMSNTAVIPNFMWIVALFIACSFTVPGHAQMEVSRAAAPKDAKDATLASELEELITAVYCYCGCERETIKVCVCNTAAMIEKDFHNRLLAGQTVEQIRTNYLDTFGPQFYAVMPAEGINLLAYIMPVVILVLIGGVAFAVLRRSRQEMVTSDGLEVPKQQVSDTTVKQVEAELERYKRQN